MAVAISDARRLTREEYKRLVDEGFFGPDARIELIDGIVYEMTPQKSLHVMGVRALEKALQPLFSEGYDIRVQFPLALGPDSEPEPDLAIVPGEWTDFGYSHPTSAVLIAEVADSSLLHDRKRKAGLYARVEIPEYWLMNLVDWCLEVYRDPRDGVYNSRLVLREGDFVSPLAHPDQKIAISDLLPLRWR